MQIIIIAKKPEGSNAYRWHATIEATSLDKSDLEAIQSAQGFDPRGYDLFAEVITQLSPGLYNATWKSLNSCD